MRQTISTIVFVLTFQSVFGQVATIQDSDGWTNIHKSPNGKSEIIHKIYENEVFWYDYEYTDKLKDWISIYIPKNDFCLEKSNPYYIMGFIHKSRLLPLEKMNNYSGSGFSFKYNLIDFDSTSKIVDRYNRSVDAIDGRPIWGTDGDFPKKEVKNIEVIIQRKKIKIHKVFFNDIYECDNSFSVFKNGETFFVYQSNSDGAGGYEIVWVFDKNGLKQRLVGSII